MSLPELQHQAAEALIKTFCEERVPTEYRSEIRLEYEIRGNSIVVIERRASWKGPEHVWTTSPRAKFIFEPERHVWELRWADRNSKFHPFNPSVKSPKIAELLAQVSADPTGIFWG